MTMLPTVSRIIHVVDPALEAERVCLAGIVTGLNYGPDVPEPFLHVAVFTKRGDPHTVVLTLQSRHWHDPLKCPYLEDANAILANFLA